MADESFAKQAVKQRDAAILRSLLTCFNTHGCFETTLDQVAGEVGIGKGTLYRHYSSREDLFEAALEAGIEDLIVRCRGIWEAHVPDFDAALRRLIGELVALNHQGAALSPSALSRLACGCRWLRPSRGEDGKLAGAFAPLVRGWQAVGLFERTMDPSWIAAVMLALVNSLAVTRHGSKVEVKPSVTSAGPRRAAHEADLANRIVGVLRRAFTPATRIDTAVMAP